MRTILSSKIVIIMLFNVIGAGRLGKHIAKALSDSGLVSLAGVCNRHQQSSTEAITHLKTGQAFACLDELPAADIVFITTPDDMISSIAQTLATKGLLKPNTTVIHCSGIMGSDLLSPLKAQQCHIASFHPLKAFHHNSLDASVFKDCFCTIEGDEQALRLLKSLFTPLGAQLMTIEADKKTTYHAAAVIASNYLITLAAVAYDLLAQSGINAPDAKLMITHLMQSNLNNINAAPSIAATLTGPLVRGDIATITKHLQALDLPIQSFYKAAGLMTLPLTDLNEHQKTTFNALFQSA